MQRQQRAQAVTIISPVHRLWALWLRATWPLADRLAPVKRPLLRLSFIHFAHWSLIERVPAGVAGARRLAHPYVLFQSNFDDELSAYIDAFSLVVPGRMRAMWQGVFGFPGPRPVDRFLSFILARTTPAQYYYCAYPEASSTMVEAALRLSEEHRRFAAEAAGLEDDAFAARYAEFLTRNQLLL
ncbi:MAG TPA: hypothetical protein VKG82_10525 [Solirubrobacteraceae bacterium]|nr:hypothetical protein [Solirubrobacteraceae bacterium]HME03289.1 hypothetical protein [Solirubrobacteraceae bacterium]